MTQFGLNYACTMTGDVDVGLQVDKSEASEAPLPVIEVADLEATLSAVTVDGAEITKAISVSPAAGDLNSATRAVTNWRQCSRIPRDRATTPHTLA